MTTIEQLSAPGSPTIRPALDAALDGTELRSDRPMREFVAQGQA